MMMTDLNLNYEFPICQNSIYLNHAAVAPWPRRTTEAVEQFAQDNLMQGARHYALWENKEAQLREQLQWLLNAPLATDIALLKNTSEALSIVAYGLSWQAGDNIIITDQEFPSNRIVWESLSHQGVEVHQADVSNTPTPEAMLLARVNERTRLIAVSAVQYASGLRLNLSLLGDFCRKNNILFCVDAIQSLGAIKLDVQAIQADFVMADGHKWMLSPEGLAVFYCRPEQREALRLNQFGWHMVEQYRDFDAKTWTPATSARRFECGSPNMLGIHALSASLSLLADVGMSVVEQRVLDNSSYLHDSLKKLPEVEILSPQAVEQRAGIVTFRHQRVTSADLFHYLMKHNVFCAQRGGGIRFSPHFYTPRAQLEQAIERLIHYPQL
jgi:selenocysteine lyase/cysteine desulfurase